MNIKYDTREDSKLLTNINLYYPKFGFDWYSSIIDFICLADGISVNVTSNKSNKLKKKKKRSKLSSVGGSSCSYDVPSPFNAGGLR